MGTVYKCRDSRFDSFVAIKMLHPQFAAVDEVVTRFKTEAIAQRKLDHPNIIDVIDFIEEDGVLAIVMEFVNGKSLDELMKSASGPMGWQRAVNLCSQILSAMNYAHSFGVVHRDLKPENILVQDIGGEEFARVMDFGIAKVIGSEKLKTVAETQMGTAPYMSPQQITSAKDVDHRADIYALGVIFFEMLTGRLPFDGDTTFTIWNKACNEPAPSLLQFNRAIPGGFDAVVAKAIAKSPEDRYQNCKEFRDDLHRVAAACSGGGFSTPDVAPESAQQRPSGSTPAPGSTGQQAPAAPPSKQSAAPAPPGKRPPVTGVVTPDIVDEEGPKARKKIPGAAIVGTAVVVVIAIAAGLFLLLGGAKGAGGGDVSAAAEPVTGTTVGPGSSPVPTSVPATRRASPANKPAVETEAPVESNTAARATRAEGRVTVPKPAPQPGSLRVTWKPWAKVRINGRPEQETPYTFENLPPGRYSVNLSHPDLGTETRSVVVSSGEAAQLTGEFERPGTLSVNCVPWATVFIDGVERGNTPKEFKLKPGQYKISLRSPNASQHEAVFHVQIEPGGKETITHRF